MSNSWDKLVQEAIQAKTGDPTISYQFVTNARVRDILAMQQRITELEAQLDHYRYCLKDIDLMEWASLLKEWKDRVEKLEAQLDSQNDDLILLNDENYCHRLRIEQLEAGIRSTLTLEET